MLCKRPGCNPDWRCMQGRGAGSWSAARQHFG